MKIRPVGAELSHADGRKNDTTKLIVAFRNFAKAPKNETSVLVSTCFENFTFSVVTRHINCAQRKRRITQKGILSYV